MNFQKTNKQNIFIEKIIINNFNIFNLYLKNTVTHILFMKNFLNKHKTPKKTHKKPHNKTHQKRPHKRPNKKTHKKTHKKIILKIILRVEYYIKLNNRYLLNRQLNIRL